MVRIGRTRTGPATSAADPARKLRRGGGEAAMRAWPRALAAAGLALMVASAFSMAFSGPLQQSVAPSPELTLYRGGHIYTNDPSAPWAEAILVRGEEILAVGDDDEVSALADKGAKSVDLEKHFVMPGFNDAHVHLGSAGHDWLAVRLS